MAASCFALWLLLARLLQLLVALAAAALGGLLLVWTGLQVCAILVYLEAAAAALLVYAAVCVLALLGGADGVDRTARTARMPPGRSDRRCVLFLAASVAGDVLMSAADLAVVTLLAACARGTTGCAGTLLQATDAHTASATRQLCILQQSFYWTAFAIMFTFLATLTLTSLQLYKLVRHSDPPPIEQPQPPPRLPPPPPSPLPLPQLHSPPSPLQPSLPLQPSKASVLMPTGDPNSRPRDHLDLAAAATIMDGPRFQPGRGQHSSTPSLPPYSPREGDIHGTSRGSRLSQTFWAIARGNTH